MTPDLRLPEKPTDPGFRISGTRIFCLAIVLCALAWSRSSADAMKARSAHAADVQVSSYAAITVNERLSQNGTLPADGPIDAALLPTISCGAGRTPCTAGAKPNEPAPCADESRPIFAMAPAARTEYRRTPVYAHFHISCAGEIGYQQ